MHHMAECVGSLNDIARGGDGWDVPRLGTEFINVVCRADQLQAMDARERERQREIERRRAEARRNRGRRR